MTKRGSTGDRALEVGKGHAVQDLLAPKHDLAHRFSRVLVREGRSASEEVGEEAWAEYVRLHVCLGSHVPIRLIENHVRNYCRRMAASDASLRSREDVAFDREIFEFTLEELHAARSDSA